MSPEQGDNTTLYQDTWEQTFNSLNQLAQEYVDRPPPLLGDTRCPAAQYTFKVSDNGGQNWRNPTSQENQERVNAVARTGRCCQGLEVGCWALENAE